MTPAVKSKNGHPPPEMPRNAKINDKPRPADWQPARPRCARTKMVPLHWRSSFCSLLLIPDGSSYLGPILCKLKTCKPAMLWGQHQGQRAFIRLTKNGKQLELYEARFL